MLGGNRHEQPVLAGRRCENLATHVGVAAPIVDTQVVCIDKHRQWRHARNVRNSATLRTARHTLTAPVRWITRRGVTRASRQTGRSRDDRRRRSTPSSSGPGPTGWPPRSPWPGPGARSASTRRAATVGGGTRTEELTLPGFRHDVCSTILPLALASPFFRTLDLAARGVELIHPDAPLAHPLDGGRAAVLERSVAATAAGLGDARRAGLAAAVRAARRATPDDAGRELLRPVVHVPRHPLLMARFGLPALRSARGPRARRVPRRAGAGAVRGRRGPLDARASTAR